MYNHNHHSGVWQGKAKLCIINFKTTITNIVPGEAKPSYVNVLLQLEPEKWVHPFNYKTTLQFFTISLVSVPSSCVCYHTQDVSAQRARPSHILTLFCELFSFIQYTLQQMLFLVGKITAPSVSKDLKQLFQFSINEVFLGDIL